MKISGIFMTLAFAAAMMISTDAFAGANGKVEAVKREGRTIVIGGKSIKISGSRTTVKIKGKDADRSEIKKGMRCTANVDSGEAKMVSCK